MRSERRDRSGSETSRATVERYTAAVIEAGLAACAATVDTWARLCQTATRTYRQAVSTAARHDEPRATAAERPEPRAAEYEGGRAAEERADASEEPDEPGEPTSEPSDDAVTGAAEDAAGGSGQTEPGTTIAGEAAGGAPASAAGQPQPPTPSPGSAEQAPPEPAAEPAPATAAEPEAPSTDTAAEPAPTAEPAPATAAEPEAPSTETASVTVAGMSYAVAAGENAGSYTVTSSDGTPVGTVHRRPSASGKSVTWAARTMDDLPIGTRVHSSRIKAATAVAEHHREHPEGTAGGGS
jgi:hypothetical protein